MFALAFAYLSCSLFLWTELAMLDVSDLHARIQEQTSIAVSIMTIGVETLVKARAFTLRSVVLDCIQNLCSRLVRSQATVCREQRQEGGSDGDDDDANGAYISQSNECVCMFRWLFSISWMKRAFPLEFG